MSVWINGRDATRVEHRDRGLQYGDGLFETMRVRRHHVRLLDMHLDRLYQGLRRLRIEAPHRNTLRRELERRAALRGEAVLKLIVTRGPGRRGYRPSGRETCTRILSLTRMPVRGAGSDPARVRMCATILGSNPALAGLKSLNRLEAVLARSEWHDARVWEGLMCDSVGHIICGTMSNIFLKRGTQLITPLLDSCGVAGVVRRWILSRARQLNLRAVQRTVDWADLAAAEEVFMCNAIVGVKPVGSIEGRGSRRTLRYERFETALGLHHLLESL